MDWLRQYLDIVLLVVLAGGVVVLTRALVKGIELAAQAGGMTSKTKGQFLGYATSMPELVGTVGTAARGLLGAGLWNVGASNVINLFLFLAAALYYGRVRALAKRKFADEVGFSLLAMLAPLLLSRSAVWAGSPWTALGLFGFFVVYRVADRRLNPSPPLSFSVTPIAATRSTRLHAAFWLCTGIAGIVTIGHFLGAVAENVVRDVGVAEWAVGWILGFITSLPEMTAFFAIFAAARDAELSATDDTDCQENLDSLAASNMANLGLIYPIGIATFLLFAVG